MEWIEVSEDLPEEDREVICRVLYRERMFGPIDYGTGMRYAGRDKVSCERTGDYKVTHWMYDDLQPAGRMTKLRN